MNGPRWLKWAVGGLIAAVVVVVGGLVAIHAVEGGSAPPLTLPTVTTAPVASGATTPSSSTSTGPVTTEGVWNVSSGSTAGYRVQESLFGVSNTAIGRTTAVTGSITISTDAVTTGSFSVDMTKVSSDRSQRDDQFQTRIMDTSSFPTATFKLTQPIALGTLPANGVQVKASATGDLMLHGVTKSVTFSVNAQRNGSTIQVQGSIPITFGDWNISNPSGGPATTGNTGALEFLLTFTHS